VPAAARVTIEYFFDDDEPKASALPGASASAVVRLLSRSAVALSIDDVPGSPKKMAE
jgi:hypothetical protein